MKIKFPNQLNLKPTRVNYIMFQKKNKKINGTWYDEKSNQIKYIDKEFNALQILGGITLIASLMALLYIKKPKQNLLPKTENIDTLFIKNDTLIKK